jgi:pimeloyl-ACP methyl ester carboxylesterase
MQNEGCGKMKKEKINIKNRKNQKIAVLLERNPAKKGLVFVMHGLGGFKEQPHIQLYAETFTDEGYISVRFDTTNTFGESEGNYENATVTNYYEDLEDVIKWAEKQEFYQKPFILIGHSLGSICIALYAEEHPEKVKALAPTSTVVSGKLSCDSGKDNIEEWKKTGWRIEPSKSRPGEIKRLPWSHMEDRLKYDLLKKTDKLTMPVLLIVGSEDKGTPVEHQKMLFDRLPGKKEFHIIEGAQHTFKEKNHLEEIKKILKIWIEEVDRK